MAKIRAPARPLVAALQDVMPKEIFIRDARPGDASSLAQIHIGARAASMPWLAVIHSENETVDWMAAQVIAHQRVRVATVDDAAVGFYAHANGWLEQLYVQLGFQNAGIGTRLFNDLCATEAKPFQFWVFQRNAGARRFYERHGCRLLQLTNGKGNEEGDPDALYEKSPAAASVAESVLPHTLSSTLAITPLKDPEVLRILAAEATTAGHRMVARLIEEWNTGENRFDKPGERAYIAMLDGGIIGVCGLNVDPFAGNAGVGRVRRLFVSAALRRRGIGSAIMQRLAHDAQGRFNELHLRTHDARAAAFYESIRFAQVAGVEHCTHRRRLGD